ncbi:alpha/beta fold hydrolase [Streptomyces sp. NPDC004227]
MGPGLSSCGGGAEEHIAAAASPAVVDLPPPRRRFPQRPRRRMRNRRRLRLLPGGWTQPRLRRLRLQRFACRSASDRARFATPELSQERSEAALKRPEHLANIAAVAPRAPIPIWLDLNRVSTITAPSLLIRGRDDRVVSFESTLFLASNIRDSRAHLINPCGHWALLEHADEFNRLVTDFVTRH